MDTGEKEEQVQGGGDGAELYLSVLLVGSCVQSTGQLGGEGWPCPKQITSQRQLDQLCPQPWPLKAVWSQRVHAVKRRHSHPTHTRAHTHKAATAYLEIFQLLLLEGIHGLCQVVGGTVSVHRGPLCTGLRLASGSQEVEGVTGQSWPLDTYYSGLVSVFFGGSFSCLMGSLGNLVIEGMIRQDRGKRVVTSQTDLPHSCVTS